MTTEAEATLVEIVSTVLKRPVAPGEALRREDEPRWDSLRHLEIVFALEAALGVAFTADEISEAADLDALRRKLRAPHAP